MLPGAPERVAEPALPGGCVPSPPLPRVESGSDGAGREGSMELRNGQQVLRQVTIGKS